MYMYRMPSDLMDLALLFDEKEEEWIEGEMEALNDLHDSEEAIRQMELSSF